jgi:hypothetical protein
MVPSPVGFLCFRDQQDLIFKSSIIMYFQILYDHYVFKNSRKTMYFEVNRIILHLKYAIRDTESTTGIAIYGKTDQL